MLNFSFQNTTQIRFGEGQIASLSKQIPSDAKILVTYGGGSIKSNGVYDQVVAALDKHTWFEFSGIESPNLMRMLHLIMIARNIMPWFNFEDRKSFDDIATVVQYS